MNRNMKKSSVRHTWMECMFLMNVLEWGSKETSEKKSRPAWICFLFYSMQAIAVFFLLVLGSFLAMISRYFGGLQELMAGILCFGLSVILAVSVYLFVKKNNRSRYLNLVGFIGILLLAVITQFSAGINILFGMAIIIAVSGSALLIQALWR